MFKMIGGRIPEYFEWDSASPNKKRKIIDKWVDLGYGRSIEALNNLVRASYEGESLDASRGLKNVFSRIIAEAMASKNPTDAQLVVKYIDSGTDEALDALSLQGSDEFMTEFLILAKSASIDSSFTSDVQIAKAPDDEQFFTEMVDLLVSSFSASEYELNEFRNENTAQNQFLFDVECAFESGSRLVQGTLTPEAIEYDLFIYELGLGCPYWPSDSSIEDVREFISTYKVLVGATNTQTAAASMLYIKVLESTLSLNVKGKGTFLSDHGLGSFAIDRLNTFVSEVGMLEKKFNEVLADFYDKDK